MSISPDRSEVRVAVREARRVVALPSTPRSRERQGRGILDGQALCVLSESRRPRPAAATPNDHGNKQLMKRILIGVALLVAVAVPVGSLAALKQQPPRLTAQPQTAQTTPPSSSTVVPLRCVMRQTYQPHVNCRGGITLAGDSARVSHARNGAALSNAIASAGDDWYQVDHASVSIGDLRHMYAPSVLTVNGTKRMWLGGGSPRAIRRTF